MRCHIIKAYILSNLGNIYILRVDQKAARIEMSVLGMDKARECSRVHAEDDKIMCLRTEAKEKFSLAVCSFMLQFYCITDTRLRQRTSNVTAYFGDIDSNRLLWQYHLQYLHNADPRTSFRLPSVVKQTEW
jgi:hypothetical protein